LFFRVFFFLEVLFLQELSLFKSFSFPGFSFSKRKAFRTDELTKRQDFLVALEYRHHLASELKTIPAPLTTWL